MAGATVPGIGAIPARLNLAEVFVSQHLISARRIKKARWGRECGRNGGVVRCLGQSIVYLIASRVAIPVLMPPLPVVVL